MPQCRLVHGSTERAQIVVVAHPLELAGLAVQGKTFFRDERDGADAEDGLVGVRQPLPDIHAGTGLVQGRMLRRPARGPLHQELLDEGRPRPSRHSPRGHDRTGWGQDIGLQPHRKRIRTVQTGLQAHRGECFFDMRGRHIGSPHRHMDIVGEHQVHVPVQTRPRIPARRVRQVLQPHRQDVLPGSDGIGDITME